jgi:hypothetical protein
LNVRHMQELSAGYLHSLLNTTQESHASFLQMGLD